MMTAAHPQTTDPQTIDSSRSVMAGSAAGLALTVLMLSGCSGPATPTTGHYRAVLNLRGGELPLPLSIASDTAGGQITLTVPGTDGTPATITAVLNAGQLRAELPNNTGTLTLRFTRSELDGDLRFTDPKGQAVTLPVKAELSDAGQETPWRFVKEPSTDNADISGNWQLEAVNPDHFNMPVSVQLNQKFDQVDGTLLTPEGKSLAVVGQVHGDEVYLSTLGNGRALLLKGKVNAHGELQGESWMNLGTAHPWVARRQTAMPAEEPIQPVVLPWSVPPLQPVPQAVQQ